MAKIIEDNVDLENIDPKTCKKAYDGKPLPGGKCRVRLELNDQDPKHARIVPIDDDDKITDRD